MEIMTEARREDKDKVEKAVVLNKDSEIQYAEHVGEPAPGIGITSFMMTESLKDVADGTFDQPMKKKPKLLETDSRKPERKPRSIMPERKQSSINLAGKQLVPTKDSTQISEGKSLQLKPKSTGEEEDKKETRTQHLRSINKYAQIIVCDPDYAAELGPDVDVGSRRCRNPEYLEPKMLAPEVLRRKEERRLQVRFVPAREGEKEGHVELFRMGDEGQIEFLRDKKGRNEWFRKDQEGRIELLRTDKEGRREWVREDLSSD